MKRLFSGIQPTGNIHIGNYLGAISRWAGMQQEFDSIFCIVDLHAITVPQDPKTLRAKILEMAGLLLAAGINAEKSLIFVQSQVCAHCQLAWILNCTTPMGWMQRMTQFKEKSVKLKEKVSVGLFDYPILMAADILLYDTDVVPVGEDQKQHVELARNIAEKFNSLYGQTFQLPEPLIAPVGGRIMALDEPTKKMSKSDESPDSVIGILDSPDDIARKITKATTDSQTAIKFDASRPGIYNLLVIYELFSGMARENIEQKFASSNYSQFKKDLASLLATKLKPFQEQFQKISADKSYISSILDKGAQKARPLAERTLLDVKQKIGLY
ncbi:MAG: tryptophan--tRNA ligase [Candidatus Nealsonbacteria bacterium CG23_combo_of_CG06-09_8_20_14_all_40_13]|uniref:Tryptophan--tRNA ligase n=1 Tax=Candidatus Nealsonbacteria bacterium CG23_combo_of_CG06-09_8_20_14_all_40_13 TaxID=1974724 RepID=A0A2G9YQC1_9BACT|nr:MAG: tryptophan--tRNA ligase [Candidatus Nealsonbacteria bacterium CG23_combo_of_CG06-09_8_20_14_all_40_13]PIR71278.1 MAG: tryptophan--tRNA ligase [Candidatus Nealsonbacteria bacterium CG10_big_fil_rev_8_21_14_0_10_40_24]PIU43467.1 MAG: tryptophan--tRNA ligase [Candidatus Nealsonbacteria bacterium CG07_land_8_20_14_0_80_40_10]